MHCAGPETQDIHANFVFTNEEGDKADNWQDVIGKLSDYCEPRKNEQQSQGQQKLCIKCGIFHKPRKCPAFGQVCFKYQGIDHFGRMCGKFKDMTRGAFIKCVQQVDLDVDDDAELYNAQHKVYHLDLDPIQREESDLKHEGD